MKSLIENLFESKNIDAKCILNRSTKIIEKSILETIESEGATTEVLEKLGVPVFKYGTQITIHGLFPELMVNYLGGYKNLFQNKNKSIGVKWVAVDYSKKVKIYNTCKDFANWRISKDSTGINLYKNSKTFTNKEEYKLILSEMQNELEKIDKSLFYGLTGVNLYQLYGSYFLESYISIGSVKETNVNKVIESICQSDINTINTFVEAKLLKEKNERDAENLAYKLKNDAEIKLRLQSKAAAEKTLLDAGFENKKVVLSEGLKVVVLDVHYTTNTYSFIQRTYHKPKGKRDFRYMESRSNTLDFKDVEYCDLYAKKSHFNDVAGFIFNAPEVKKPIEVSKPIESKKETVKNDIQIVEYSEKSFAVIGNTKPIKDKLASLGGRFNFRLTCGAGWIFSNTKKEVVLKFIN